MNYWKHPAWRAVQLTSVQFVEVCTVRPYVHDPYALTLDVHVCWYVHVCLVCTGSYNMFVFTQAFLCLCVRGQSWQSAGSGQQSSQRKKRDGVCIDIEVE